MANVKISQLASAAALTGTEEVPVVQGSATVKTTVQDIADLAGGASYTSYVARISGTTPSVVVFENTTEWELFWQNGPTYDQCSYVATVPTTNFSKIAIFLTSESTKEEFKGTTVVSGRPGYTIETGSVFSNLFVWYNGGSTGTTSGLPVTIEIRIYP